MSAAATSFGVLAIAAGDYCNTINDVDAARTAAAVARQENALRQRRRASSMAVSSSAASSSAATQGSRPLSGALSSAKPSRALSSMKTVAEEEDEPTAAATDVEKAAPLKAVPWWRCKAAIVAVFAFATTTMLNESILDLYQFYATSTPCASRGKGAVALSEPLANDGLCLDVTKTSLTVAVGGAGVVVFSILAYPPMQRRYGVAFCCKFGLLVGAVMCLVFAASK